MKRFLPFLLVLVAIFLLSNSVFAHSGRTDSDGGHNGPGGYHYHHGYPAHKHRNRKCPYEFDDKTNHDSAGKVTEEATQSATNKTPSNLTQDKNQQSSKPSTTLPKITHSNLNTLTYIKVALILFFISAILNRMSDRLEKKHPHLAEIFLSISFLCGIVSIPFWIVALICSYQWQKLREKRKRKKEQQNPTCSDRKISESSVNSKPYRIDNVPSEESAPFSPEPLKCNLEIEERNKQYWADMARIIGSVLNSETENKKDKAFEVAKEKILDIPCSDTVRLDESDHSEIFAGLYEIYNDVREKNTFKKCLGTKSELLGKYIADYKDHLEHIRLLTVFTYLKENEKRL